VFWFPEVIVVVLVGEDDVEGLEVQVQDPLAVDKLDSPHNLRQYLYIALL